MSGPKQLAYLGIDTRAVAQAGKNESRQTVNVMGFDKMVEYDGYGQKPMRTDMAPEIAAANKAAWNNTLTTVQKNLADAVSQLADDHPPLATAKASEQHGRSISQLESSGAPPHSHLDLRNHHILDGRPNNVGSPIVVLHDNRPSVAMNACPRGQRACGGRCHPSNGGFLSSIWICENQTTLTVIIATTLLLLMLVARR